MVQKRFIFNEKDIVFECQMEASRAVVNREQLKALFATIKTALEETDPKPIKSIPQVNNKTLTPEQIQNMKSIKIKLKIRSNDEFNPHVRDWSAGQKNSYKDLDGSNIDDFIKYMETI